MEGNELRLGNLVDYNGKHGIVITIGKKSVIIELGTKIKEHSAYTESENPNLDEIKPIPLTNEWLLKFGFEKWPNRNTFEWKDGDYRSIQIEIKKTAFEIYLCGCYSATSQECFPVDDIIFVHQLQNLYFALTGKELTLK